MRKKVTYKGIKGLEPCYDPIKVGMPKNYSKSIPEFIDEYRDKVESREDILWLLCRKEYMTNKDMRLFAVWCARESLKLVKETDERSVNACNVAEKFANGEATKEELAAARSAACAAADSADSAAAASADSAAWSAASAAADSAAWSAAASAAASAAQVDKLKTYFI